MDLRDATDENVGAADSLEEDKADDDDDSDAALDKAFLETNAFGANPSMFVMADIISKCLRRLNPIIFFIFITNQSKTKLSSSLYFTACN